jgi:nucleoid-associated protein YgaU
MDIAAGAAKERLAAELAKCNQEWTQLAEQRIAAALQTAEAKQKEALAAAKAEVKARPLPPNGAQGPFSQ